MKLLGTGTFRISSFTRIGLDFKPYGYKGHKLLVKGVLLRQRNAADRINPTSLASLAASCPQ